MVHALSPLSTYYDTLNSPISLTMTSPPSAFASKSLRVAESLSGGLQRPLLPRGCASSCSIPNYSPCALPPLCGSLDLLPKTTDVPLLGMPSDEVPRPVSLPWDHLIRSLPFGADGGHYAAFTTTSSNPHHSLLLQTKLPSWIRPAPRLNYPLAVSGRTGFSHTLPLPLQPPSPTQWHPQIPPFRQASFHHLITTILSTIILPVPLPASACQHLLHHLELPASIQEETYYTRLAHRPPSLQSLENGLGLTGDVKIPMVIWKRYNLPSQLPLHPVTTPSTFRSSPPFLPAHQQFLHQLQQQNLIQTIPTCCPAAPAFTSYKSETKLRFIINLRLYNSCFPKPPSFLLPHLDVLLNLPEFGQLWFVKLDLQNCFWSLQLPADVRGAFYGCLFNTSFFTRRLPFGWSYSPILAQDTVGYHLLPVLKLTSYLWQYMDDVLIASTDPCFLTFLAEFTVHLLTQAGFRINADKSMLIPSKDITWLGRTISATAGTITTAPAQAAAALQQIAYLHIVHLCMRNLQRLLGTLQWLSAPASINAANLASAYCLLTKRCPPMILPLPIAYSLIYAVLTTLVPLRPRPLPPPLSMAPIYADAAPKACSAPGPLLYQVASVRPHCYATAVPAPTWVRDQQCAELYSLFHALRQGFLRGLSHICLITDNLGAYYTLLSGKISVRNAARLRILRRINRLLYQYGGNVQVMWVPSTLNMADPFSRSATPPKPSYSLHLLRYLSNCHTLKRFWWHSNFYR